VAAAAARGAVQGASVGEGACDGGSAVLAVETLDGMQHIFSDLDVAGVSDAKERLREVGRTDLASRLGKYSKVRNGVAHRDVSLQGAIQAAIAGKSFVEQESKLSEKVKGVPKLRESKLQAIEAQVSSLVADKAQLEVKLDEAAAQARQADAALAALKAELTAVQRNLSVALESAAKQEHLMQQVWQFDSAGKQREQVRVQKKMRAPYVEGLPYPEEETEVRAACLAALLAHGSASYPPEQCERIACQPDFDNVKRYLDSWT